MRHYFNNEVQQWPISTNPYRSAPKTEAEKTQLVDQLQDAKTEFYIEIVEKVATARPGVLELIDEAIADPNIKVQNRHKGQRLPCSGYVMLLCIVAHNCNFYHSSSPASGGNMLCCHEGRFRQNCGFNCR